MKKYQTASSSDRLILKALRAKWASAFGRKNKFSDKVLRKRISCQIVARLAFGRLLATAP